MLSHLLGWVTFAEAGESVPPAAPPPPPSNALVAVRRALREFDRFLDHHPLLEDELRLNPALTMTREFQEKNPDLRDFLAANPDVVVGLKVYPRYFLYRALLRQASAPLAYSELAEFREIFEKEPKVEVELNQKPESIRDPAFLNSHTNLDSFLRAHPALARVFLPDSDAAKFK